MNEYNIKVDFTKGKIFTNLKKLVQNDYNTTKLNFTFDKEGRVLFKLLYPDGTQYVDEIQNNELIFGPGILNQEGDYEYEISLYTVDGRLTDYATKSFEVRSELVNTDELVAPDDRVPVLDGLINEVNTIKKDIEDGKYNTGDGTGGTTNYNSLNNKPKINGVELKGNKTLDELGIVDEINARVKLIQNGKIEYDIGNVTIGGMISETTGAFFTREDANLGASEYYIPLYIGEKHEVSTTLAGFNIYFYDEDKNFITAQYVPQTTKKDTVTFTNTEYHYARIGSWVSDGMTQEKFDSISFCAITDGIGKIETDTTLTKGGVPADAKTVGEKIDFLRKFNGWIDTNTGVYIDTTAKTLTFGANSYVTYGNQLFNVSNTTHDISTMIGGAWVYLDISASPYKLTKDKSTSYVILLGALWKPNHLADLHMDKTKLFIDGMSVSYTGRYHNKTINCLGDSMTEGVGTTKAYHQWFGQLCGFKTINNYGLGGSCIAPIGNNDPAWTGEENIQSFYERYNSMPSADAITVFGGVNDWCTGRELGNITDTTTDTFYGAMKSLCEGLIAKYPTSDIFMFSSPQCDYINRPANKLSGTEWAGNTEGYNRKGYKLQDYANAMSEVCGIYGITFCSLTNNLFYGLSGVLGDHKGTSGDYGNDALHPNAEGHKKIALKMASVINSGVGDTYTPTETLATKNYVNNIIANLPTGGGSSAPQQMELIASGTNTEAIRRFRITVDNDGNAFELTRAYFVVKNILTTGTDGNQSCHITLGGTILNVGATSTESRNRDVIAYADINGVMWATQGGGGIYAQGGLIACTNFEPNTTIQSAEFTCAAAAHTFQAGATYELWGVRK